MYSQQAHETSDDMQINKLSSNNQPSHSSDNQPSHSQKQNPPRSTPTWLFIFIGSILLVVLMVGNCLLVLSMQNKMTAFETQKGSDVRELQEQVQELKKIVKAYELEFEQLGMEVNRLAQYNNKLPQELKQGPIKPMAWPTKLESINQTALLPYIQKKFDDYKIAINFLHAHDRESYYYQKVDYLKSCLSSSFLMHNWKGRDAFLLALNNFELPHFNINIENERRANEKKDHDRLSKEYDFTLPELPFCIVVATVNNARNFRYQYNLQSMVNLDYKNFKIVIIDDASNDNTYELILQWIEQNKITHDIVVLRNEKRLTAVPNIYTAVTQHCRPDDIIVLVDGDDELLGRYAFKVFNHLYQKSKVDVVYSNHLQLYTHTKQVLRGWSKSFSDEQMKNNRYRDIPQKIAHLRSFKAKLYLKIKEADMKDAKGEWYTSTYDEVISLPILQMSCGRILYVDEFFYLYNFGIGTNDLQVDKGLQKRIADEVKFSRKKYECIPELK